MAAEAELRDDELAGGRRLRAGRGGQEAGEDDGRKQREECAGDVPARAVVCRVVGERDSGCLLPVEGN